MTDLGAKLTEADLRFIAKTLYPDRRDLERVASALRDDREVLQAALGADRLFQRLSGDPEILVQVSPRLFFAVLLRRAARDLRAASYTVERERRQRIPVFDTHRVADLLGPADMRDYLADMLASFSKVQTYSVGYRVREGVWRRMRFNDLDIDALMRYAGALDEAQRFGPYKRIADVCLFVAGVFPEHAEVGAYNPVSGKRRPGSAGRPRRNLAEYRDEGQAFYRLAAKHATARIMSMVDILARLSTQFLEAQKALSYMTERYVWFDKHQLFGAG